MNKVATPKSESVFQKILDDNKTICKCIQEGGDIEKIAKKRGIRFAMQL